MKSKFYLTPIAALLGLAMATPAMAGTPEAESNDSLSTAQDIPVTAEGFGTLNGEIASTSDLDFYRVYVLNGSELVIDFNQLVYYSAGEPYLDANVAVYDASGQNLAYIDNLSRDAIIDAGSRSRYEPLLKVVVPADGYYYVGVSGPGRFLTGHDGTVTTGTGTSYTVGKYDMEISGAAVPPKPLQEATEVSIEVKPGSHGKRYLSHNSRGSVPVAILSTDTFDATTEIDRASLTFGKTGDENSLRKCKKRGRDVNDDGNDDLICIFSNRSTGLTWEDKEGILKGKTTSGEEIQGTGSLKTPEHKGKHHHDD